MTKLFIELINTGPLKPLRIQFVTVYISTDVLIVKLVTVRRIYYQQGIPKL